MTATLERVHVCGCGNPIGPRNTSGRCTSCATTAVYERNRQMLIEDVEWLLETREFPARIAQRLRTTEANLCRRLWRAGRPDLAAHFADKPTKECPDCGGPCKASSTRCDECHRDRRTRARAIR